MKKDSNILLNDEMSKWYIGLLKEFGDDRAILSEYEDLKHDRYQMHIYKKQNEELSKLDLNSEFVEMVEVYNSLKSVVSFLDGKTHNLEFGKPTNNAKAIVNALQIADELLRVKVLDETPDFLTKIKPDDEYIEYLYGVKKKAFNYDSNN